MRNVPAQILLYDLFGEKSFKKQFRFTDTFKRQFQHISLGIPALEHINECDINEIAQQFKENRVVVIAGESGSGKSTLANAFARSKSQFYKVIYRIDCSNAHSFLHSLGCLAFNLHMPETSSNKTRIREIYQILNVTQSLILLDNADDSELFQDLLEAQASRFLITSRHENWPQQSITRMPRLKRETQIEIFTRITGKRVFDVSIFENNLVGLVLGAHYIAFCKISIDEYSDLLQVNDQSIVDSILELTLHLLQEQYQISYELLSLLIILYTQKIDKSVYSKCLDCSDFELIKARHVLETLGLLTINNECMISISPVVAERLREFIPTRKHGLRRMIRAFNGIMAPDLDSIDQMRIQNICIHCQIFFDDYFRVKESFVGCTLSFYSILASMPDKSAIFSNYTKIKSIQDFDSARTMLNLAKVVQSEEGNEASLPIFERVLTYESLQDLIKAEVLEHIGQIKIRDETTALNFFENAWAIKLSYLQRPHPLLISLSFAFARVYFAIRDFSQSSQYLEMTIGDIGVIYGDTDVRLCECFFIKAQIQWKEQEIENALFDYERSLKHSEMLRESTVSKTRLRMAQCYKKLRNFKRTIIQCQRIIDSSSGIEALKANRILAQVYIAMDDPDEALEYINLGLEINQDIDNTKERGRLLMCLSRYNLDNQQAQEALSNCQDALDSLRKAQKNEDFSEIIDGMQDLSEIYCQLNDLNQAISHLEYAIMQSPENPVLLEKLGDLHKANNDPDSAIARYEEALDCVGLSSDLLYKIATTHLSADRLHEALDTFDLLIEQYKDSYDRTGIAKVLLTVAKIHKKLGDHTKVVQILNQALQQGPEDPKILTFLAKMTSDPHEVKNHLIKALQLYYKRNSRFNICKCLQWLGSIHKQTGCYKEALQCYEAALELQKDEFNASHEYIAHTMYKIGQTLVFLGELDYALDMLGRSLDMNISLNGEFHVLNSLNLAMIANVYGQKAMFQQALENYQKELNVLENTMPLQQSEISLCYYNIGVTLSSLDLLTEAYSAYQKALRARNSAGQYDLPTYAHIMYNAGVVQEKMSVKRRQLGKSVCEFRGTRKNIEEVENGRNQHQQERNKPVVPNNRSNSSTERVSKSARSKFPSFTQFWMKREVFILQIFLALLNNLI